MSKMRVLFLAVFLMNSVLMIYCDSDDYIRAGYNHKYPFRICSIAKGTDLMRFDRDISCSPYKSNAKMSEGFFIIYKTNIETYTFPVRTYKNELTFQTSYRDVGVVYFLDRTVMGLAMPVYEANLVNSRAQCYSAVAIKRPDGTVFSAYHEDNNKNETLELFPLNFKSVTNKRFITTKEPYFARGPLWLYSTSTSLNCIVTEATAKAKYPFSYFALTTGEIVEGSPFFDGSNGKHFAEPLEKLTILENYTMIEDLMNGMNGATTLVRKIAFLEKGDTLFSWEIKEENESVCMLKHWTTVTHGLRAETDETYHFISKELTAAFVTPKDSLNLTDPKQTCIKNEFENIIKEVYMSDYNDTYSMNGSYQIFKTTGDLILIWQPLVQKSLMVLEQGSVNLRRRRDLVDVKSRHDILYVQLQYLYDTLKDYINDALGNLAESWCLDQKRTITMLHELSKISPSSIVSEVYGRPISAQLHGDVLAISKCIEVNQSSVQLHKSMRVVDAKGLRSETMCYNRPLVTFSFVNSTPEVVPGQLGLDNEILLGDHRTEECEIPSTKIFLSGNHAHVYTDYTHTNSTPIEDIEVLDAFIRLKIDPLENADFKLLDLYSPDELSRANVFDLENILREYNSYKSALYTIEAKIATNTPSYVNGINSFLQGLGAIGTGLGSVISVTAGALGDIVGGVVSFLKNPFGGGLMLILAIVVVVIIIVVFVRQKHVLSKPIDMMFPYATNPVTTVSSVTGTTVVKTPSVKDADGGTSVAVSEKEEGMADVSGQISGDEYSQEDALKMLKAIKSLDESYRRKPSSSESHASKPSLIDRIRYRGYKSVNVEEA
ncbi:glycoprotein B [Human betaherpesvirus 6B]|uniref:U39 n=3 Tax=Roseolovirus TaxID=40272 RepID=A0A1W6J8G8_9BETA|nr:glycoprotein B [Human betaherpesvirus 6B]ARJ99840.2 U39 [Human betaherpesvirus 6]ARM61575.1 U39 [Human betaherpesvirus 6]ARM62484.1 U39 [Human betaherpesvirus 6]QBQ65379.1 glycoprotein B [Human betaherpesvirus 6B]